MPTDYLLSARVFFPKALLQETEYSETYGEYSSQYKKNKLMLHVGQDLRTAINQTYFVFVPLFSKPILTKQNIACTKDFQQFLASRVSFLRINKATNSSTSKHPFFSYSESPCTW